MLTLRLVKLISGIIFLLTWILGVDSIHAVEMTIKLSNGQILQLNGMGEAKQLGATVYIGGLYLTERTRDKSIIGENSTSHRMSFHFNHRISSRAWKRLWLDYISINTPAEILQPHAKEVQTFLAFFQGALKVGDRLVIDFLPELGTLVSLNGVPIGVIKQQGFYQLLLNTWIGPRPLNQDFQLAIFGKATNPETEKEYYSLIPTKDRIAQVKRWALRSKLVLANLNSSSKDGKAKADKKEAEEKAAAEKVAAEIERNEKAIAEKAAREKAAAQKATLEKIAAEKAAKEKSAALVLAQQKAKRDKSKAAKEAARKAKLEQLAADKAATEKVAAEKAAAEKAKASRALAIAAAKEKAKADDVAKKKVLAEQKFKAEKLAQEKLQRQKSKGKQSQKIHGNNITDEEFLAVKEGYEEELTDVILENKKYPFQKMKRGYKKRSSFSRGKVRVLLLIKVAKDGTVLTSKVLKSSGERVLDREAMALIGKAKNIPPLPSYLHVDSLEVQVIVPYTVR